MKRILAVVFAAAALFAGCTKSGDEAKSEAADFKLQDLRGNHVRLADFRGKVVLLDFWATWCPPCRASVPGLEALHRTYASKGLVILAVSLDYSGLEVIQSFQTEYGITYTILKGDEAVAEKYMVRSIPMIVLVNRDGTVTKRIVGMVNEEELEKDIKMLL